MSGFMELVDMIYLTDKTPEKMREMNTILDSMFVRLKQVNQELYNDTINKFETMAYAINETKAKEIISKMKPYGEHWNCEQVKEFISTKGIHDSVVEYWLVMNMGYNDYHNLAKMVGKEEDTEFYFEFAKEFINDIDGPKFKVSKYFSM